MSVLSQCKLDNVRLTKGRFIVKHDITLLIHEKFEINARKWVLGITRSLYFIGIQKGFVRYCASFES